MRALSKAAKIALSEQNDLVPDAEESLRRLHPSGNPVLCPIDDSFDVVFESEEVARAIKSFPRVRAEVLPGFVPHIWLVLTVPRGAAFSARSRSSPRYFHQASCRHTVVCYVKLA